MLIREDDDGSWVAIGQASHAWLCGQVARAWGAGRFPRPEPFEAVCLGAEQHDVGMAEWDLEPTIDASGRPTPFNRLPRALHLALWRRAPRKVETQCRYAALLVSLHATTLYTAFPVAEAERPAVDAFLAEQAGYRRGLQLGVTDDDAAVDANRRLVFAWDALSLGLCLGWPEHRLPAIRDAGGEEVRIAVARTAAGAALAPWPFAADAVEVCAEGRRLRGAFDDEPSLHRALAEAPSETLRFTLTPAARGVA